jgi:hypothetical protein
MSLIDMRRLFILRRAKTNNVERDDLFVNVNYAILNNCSKLCQQGIMEKNPHVLFLSLINVLMQKKNSSNHE